MTAPFLIGLAKAPVIKATRTRIVRNARSGVRTDKNCLFLAHRHDDRIGCRDHRGAARTAVDQRHLAEDAQLRQRVEQAIAEPNFDFAALDDEQFLRRIALTENDVTSFVATRRRACAGQDTEIDDRSFCHTHTLTWQNYFNLMTTIHYYNCMTLSPRAYVAGGNRSGEFPEKCHCRKC
jgi:hypothetical protein